MADRLKGKIAFITGAGMGMGREASVLFAEEAHGSSSPISTGKAAQDTVALVEKAGGQAVAVTGDVALERTSSAWSRRGCGASARCTCSTTAGVL